VVREPVRQHEDQPILSMTTTNRCAVLTLNRPAVLNALSTELMTMLSYRLHTLRSDDYRAVIITGGSGRSFSVGADLTEMEDRRVLDHYRYQAIGRDLMKQIESLPLITVAAIDGYALGGGLELALACTFRVASHMAQFGFPEIRLALIPGYGGTQRATRLVGVAWAQELILTGRTVDAAEARQRGLVNRVVDGDVVEAALDMAGEVSCFSLPALELARNAIVQGCDVPLAVGLEIEAHTSALAHDLADSREGISAFLEKRSPRFRDR
jgi:enoyl-CoA hydratase